jgi:hypothetical protein
MIHVPKLHTFCSLPQLKAGGETVKLKGGNIGRYPKEEHKSK